MNKRLITFYTVLILGVALTVEGYAAEVDLMQKNKTFILKGMEVNRMTIKTGDTIVFKNGDPFTHNIFSLGQLGTFDLGPFGENEQRKRKFDEPGTVEIECAIHPQMFIEVTVE